MLDTSTVHTAGINIESLTTTLASITVIVSAVGIVMVKAINRSITDNTRTIVTEIIAKEVTPKFTQINTSIGILTKTQIEHSVKLARLEGFQEGKKQTVAEANIRTRDNGNT